MGEKLGMIMGLRSLRKGAVTWIVKLGTINVYDTKMIKNSKG